MQADKMNELQAEVTKELQERAGTIFEQAEHFAEQVTKKMLAEEKAFELTEDEVDMLRAYRRFITQNMPGTFFKWQTPTEPKLVLPEEPSLLVDPRQIEPPVLGEAPDPKDTWPRKPEGVKDA